MTRAITPACQTDLDCYRNDGHDGPHAYADKITDIDRLKDEVVVAARLCVNEFLTRPASLAARHVERLDDLRNALIALGPHVPAAKPIPSVRESLERLGLPQTMGRIPPEIVHPAPFDGDRATPAPALDVGRLARALVRMTADIDGLTDEEVAPVVAIMLPGAAPRDLAAAIARAYEEAER